MLTHEKPMIDLICLLVNYFFISVKFFKETHTCLTNYLMLLLFPFWFSWSTFIEIDDSESEDFVLERYRAYWERKLKSGPPHPDFEAEIAEIADSAKNNTIQRIVAETPMALLYKKDFKKLPRWDFEDVYSKDTQHRRPVSMLRQDIVKTVERINFMDVSQHSWSHTSHLHDAWHFSFCLFGFLTYCFCFFMICFKSFIFNLFHHFIFFYDFQTCAQSLRNTQDEKFKKAFLPNIRLFLHKDNINMSEWNRLSHFNSPFGFMNYKYDGRSLWSWYWVSIVCQTEEWQSNIHLFSDWIFKHICSFMRYV